MEQATDWIKATNVYEVNLRQYTEEGTIRAFAAHLPRLRDMGVHTLWFMPLTPISVKNRKGSMGSYYACSDYCAVSSEFGSLDDFRALVEQAHQSGMKVILDWVANHTGWDHVWTVQHPEWYKKDEATGDFKRASGMDDIIELDFSNTDMRREMIRCMKFWVDTCGIDGFRCDLAFWVQVDFWEEAIPQLNAHKPLFWLAESDPLERPEYMTVFDAAYTWTWMHRTETFYKEKLPLSELRTVLQRYREAPGLKTWFTSNHDENSWNGTEYEKYGDAAIPLAVFSCTWPGIPLLYSGQELPNQKRLEFFEKDPIRWQECRLHHFYKKLLELHRTNTALHAGGALVLPEHPAKDQVLAFLRQHEQQQVLVLLNLSPGTVRFESAGVEGTFRELMEGKEQAFPAGISLEPWGWKVFEKK